MVLKCKRFDGKTWGDFGYELLKGKDSEKQEEFLKACRAGKNAFLEYINRHLLSCTNSVIDGDIVNFKYKFSEKEFLHPPEDTQEIIWNAFEYVHEEMKYHCGFWGYMVISMIKNDSIKPEYFASNLNGVNETGISVIDHALESHDKETVDGCVRRVLRSMCNPAPRRSKRIVFYDFSLGKAYWRWHWSQEMSELVELEFKQILKILNENYYGKFSEKMHSGKSYISSKNVLGGLLLYLKQVDKQKITGEQLGKIIDKISYLSAWKAIEIQEHKLNQKEIEAISAIVLKEKPTISRED